MTGRGKITVQQLTSSITSLGTAFDNLTKHVKPAADQTSRISDSFQNFNKALKEIQSYGEQLTKTLDSIAPKGGSGKIKFDDTVFASFSKLADWIADSIDNTKLGKLQTFSVSIKSFTTSLKEMIAINKGAFDEVNAFIEKLNTPIAKGKKATPLSNIMDTLSSYTNTLGDLGARTQTTIPDDNGVDHIKNIINPRIQGIKDIFDTIEKMTEVLRSMGGKKIQDGFTALDQAETNLYSFILKLGNFMRGEKEVPDKASPDGGTKNVETLNNYVQGTRDVLKTIDILSANLKNMTGKKVTDGLSNVEEAKTKLDAFITQLGTLGERDAKSVKDSNGEYKVIEILDSRVQGTRDILKTIDILSANLKAMSEKGIKSGMNRITEAGTNLENFITQLGKFSRGEKTVKDEDSDSGYKTVEVLNRQVQGTRDVLKTIDILSSDLMRMADTAIPAGIDNVERAGKSLTDFINKLNEVGARDTQSKGLIGNIKSFFGGSSNDVETVINVKVQSVRDILSTIRTLSTNLNNLSTNEVNAGILAIDKANTSLYKFIDHLGSLGERGSRKLTLNPVPKEENVFQLDLERQINSKVEGVQDILRTVGNLSGKLEQMGGDVIEKGITNIDTASTNLQLFMVRLGDFGRTREERKPVEEGKESEIVEHLNSKVQSVRDVLKSVDILSSDLQNMADGNIKIGLENVEKAGRGLKAFIDKLGVFTRNTVDTTITKTDAEGNTETVEKPVEILNKNIQSVRDVLKSIDILSSDLVQMSEEKIKTGIENIDKARTALNTFMDKLGDYTRDSKTVKDSEGNKRKVEVLNEHVQSVRDIIKSVELLSNALTNLSDDKIKKALGILDTAKERLYYFIESLGSLGLRTQNADATKEAREELNEKIVAVRDILNVVNTLSNTLNRLSGLDTRGILTFSINLERAIPAITEFINKMASLAKLPSFTDFERVANAIGKVGGALRDNLKDIESSSRAWTRFKSILRQVYTAFVGGAVIYSIVRSIKSAVKEVYNLEYAMARVNTIARVSSNELKNMTHFVQDVSASYGIASEKVSKALYDINSATIKGVSSLKILEQSAKLAVAGFTDIDKVTNLIARAVNAYEYNVSEAAKISDILFVTVERGINPMEELSEYMGRLFTVSANAGVSLEEVGAGLATLTARGYQTNVASTALNSAILKLSTGTKELNKLFQQYGYASSASALRTVGLTGALQVLYKATNGATEKLHDLGFNYRDIRAATTLASGAIDEYNKTLALMNDETYKAGLTNKAYSEVQDTLIFKINRLKETYTVLIQRVSEYMNKNKTIKDFIDLLTSGIESLTKSLQGFNITLQEQLNIGLVTFIPKVVLAYGVLKAVPKILLAIKTGFIGVNGVTKAWSLSLKGLGSAFTTSLTVINALLSFFKDLSNIIESGTLKSGLKAVFSTAEGALSALAGLAGRFIDFITFTTTNFGEKWSQHFLKPDYKPVGDESTAKGFTEQELLFRDKVSELNGSFIKKGLSEFDYRTENIEAEFNSIMNSIQNYADSLKLDEEFVNKNTEAVRTAYNDKIKETKAVNALTPNMKALSDVFEEVSKKLRENADKQEDSIAKLVSSSMKAQFGFDTIAKETGMSLRQIKNAFSSDTNIADFKKILEITPAMFSESAKIGMSLFKNLPQEERLSRVFDIIERNDKIPEYAIPKFEALRNSKATFNDLANVTDFNKIANYVADALQLSPEVRKAMSELGEGTSAAVKDTLELSKTLTKLGYDVTKIKPQLSASEIVGNVFGLSEITTLKESLRNKLVKPSELESFDDAIIDSILSNVMEAIGANKSVEEINAMIQEAFPDLSSEQLEDISGSIYSIASRLIKISSDFVKQFSELDFSKTMNRLKFGSELSSFKQYQQVGKEMLKNLYDRTIEGIDFRTLLNEFDRNKEQFGFNQARLMFIEKFGKTGEIAWTAFVDAFKDLGDLAQQFINPLNTEFRNLKKRGKDFVKNYRDSLLSPIEQFQKTEALLNRRLANIREQSKNGRLNPESIKNAMDTIDKLYKLNEETMNLKVPASITASEFVRSGSKEAFDLVARNVFKDTYKVNVRQEKLQEKLVKASERLVTLATQGSKNVSESVTYP